MKKLITVIVSIALLLVCGYVVARYFDRRYRDYEVVAEAEIPQGADIAYLNQACGTLSGGYFTLYALNAEGGALETVFSGAIAGTIAACTDNYVAFEQEGTYSLYSLWEKQFTQVCVLEGTEIVLKQFGNDIYIRVDHLEQNRTRHYMYERDSANLTDMDAQVDFEFVDYCKNLSTGEDYYLVYTPVGEYVRTGIRVYVNGKESAKLAEFDQVLYNKFYYADGLFILIGQEKLLFLDEETLVCRQEYYYDTSALTQIILNKCAVFLAEEGYYFDGVNNLLSVQKTTQNLYYLPKHQFLCGYQDHLVYASGKQVYALDPASGSGDEAPIFSTDKDIVEMNFIGKDTIAVVFDGSLSIMQKSTVI